MTNITVDFSKTLGPVKPMHAVGQPPFIGNYFEPIHYLKDANIPYSRLHDVGGPFGGNLFVDIPNIFRDFDADETNPENYDFTFTDMLITALMKYECEPIFRLGVTIENFHAIKAYRIFPPKDNKKWARICEHIIRHYNEGWADGFHYNIKYWEIWNEPDNGRDNTENMMWHGTKEQFYDLYRVSSLHLRECFGDSIKIGGYGSSGFYVVDKVEDIMESISTGLALSEAPTGWELRCKYFVDFFDGFIDMVVKENLPLDFFSHHSYAYVKSTLNRQRYVEERLNAAGLSHVEIHLNEWNPNAKHDEKDRSVASANTLAMMIVMQRTKMDMMCFYDARLRGGNYGGMFNPSTYLPTCVYYVFKAFGELYALGQEAQCVSDKDGVYAMAATNGEKNAVLISNTGRDTEIATNLEKVSKAYLIDEDNMYTEIEILPDSFILKKNQVVHIEV